MKGIGLMLVLVLVLTRLCNMVTWQAVLANSSWTANHIAQLFIAWHRPKIVYPPCDASSFQVPSPVHPHFHHILKGLLFW